jgi:hypothetical protein
MSESPEIKLLEGFCSLRFGATQEEAVAAFGEPEEVQTLSDDILGNSSTVYHYWDHGYSLFFDNNRNQIFCSVELDNKESVLYDVKVFTLREKEITALLLENGHRLTETEMQQWGEKRLSFDSAGLDCYFENNRLVSVNFGVLETANHFSFNPN